MNLNTIEKSIKCPYGCDKDAKLEWQKVNYIPSDILVYRCETCKNGFTTSESDTISLNFLNSKKRSLLRKDIINKINE